MPALPRPEDRCSNTCLTRLLTTSPNTSLPIRCSDAGGHLDLSYEDCCLQKLFLRGVSVTDHDIDSYSPGTESSRMKRQGQMLTEGSTAAGSKLQTRTEPSAGSRAAWPPSPVHYPELHASWPQQERRPLAQHPVPASRAPDQLVDPEGTAPK